jgi:hypothetical protein
MDQVLHGCATTTEAIRRAIQHYSRGCLLPPAGIFRIGHSLTAAARPCPKAPCVVGSSRMMLPPVRAPHRFEARIEVLPYGRKRPLGVVGPILRTRPACAEPSCDTSSVLCLRPCYWRRR